MSSQLLGVPRWNLGFVYNRITPVIGGLTYVHLVHAMIYLSLQAAPSPV